MTSSHGSSSSGTHAALPARALALLDELDTAAAGQLEAMLSLAMTEAEQQLFRQAEQSTSNNEQQRLLDSQRLLKHRHDDLVARALKGTLASRLNFGQPPPPRRGQAGVGLELLDEQAQAENVAVDDLAARLESRAAMTLFELGHRFAVLGARPVLETAAQPFGPHALCRALQDAVDTLDIPSAHRIEIYRAFERLAGARITAFYEALNQQLAERGILPNLRAFAPRRRGQDAPTGNDQSAPAATEDIAAAGTPATGTLDPARDTGSTDDADVGNVFAALSELLAQRRRQLGPGIVHGASHVPGSDDLQRVLAMLQSRPAEVRAPGGGMQPRSMQQLRQDMMAQLRQISPDATAPRLSPEHLDTVELMSMLFDRLVEDVHSGSGSLLLSQMQAPLLRVALADKGFFTRHDHPARRWLNTLAETSARWGGDGEDADTALVERMRAMVRRVNREFDGDSTLFDSLSDELQQQADALARKAEVTERRHIEASKGRERLELARLRAEELIAARLHLRYDTTPSLTRSLLQHAWTDVLALTLLRDGEDSDNFRRELAIADALTTDPGKSPDQFADSARLREDIEHGLARVGMPAHDAELLAREAIGDPETDAHGEPVTRTELALKLKQRKRLGSAGDDEAAETAVPGLDADEQRALDQLRTLPFGTWFDCDSDPPGTVLRRKMAWYSTKTGNCLLVNQRGARTDTTTLEQMARDMAAGRVRLPPPERGSLIDRALDSILAKLKSLVGKTGDTESAAT